MALGTAAQRAWMLQWRGAALALAEQRKRELQALSEGEALAASDALLSIGARPPLSPSRLRSSGLVQQQVAFHRHCL
jgi:hypothetical protein